METRSSQPEEELKRLLLAPELDLLAKIEERVGRLHDRVGDDKALRASVRGVIVEVMREAGVKDHERLSRILAPLMISSLREEIRGSREMMIEALYPLTGRLVTAAVRNSFRELLQTLDRQISDTFSFERWKLRIEAVVRRRSFAELMLERHPPFSVDELLVVQRETGLLIARASDQELGEGVDTDLVGSMLSAIMSFTKDAFGEKDQGELSTLEFGGSQLFLKTSPMVVVAVRTTGVAPGNFDGRLEEAFVDVLDRWGRVFSDFEGALDPQQEIDLQGDLRQRILSLAAAAQSYRAPRSSKKAIVLLLLLLGVGGALLWMQISANREVARLERTARETVASQAAISGYPVEVVFDRDAEVLRVNGLVPDVEARRALSNALAAALPQAELDVAVNTLPEPPPQEGPGPTTVLREFAQNNPIFFEERDIPMDPARAERRIARIAELLEATSPRVKLRIVGYADALGSREVNERLTLQRAQYAADKLMALGIPEARLRLVGRPGEEYLTTEVGRGSESRRTEFEVFVSGN